jgi:hypothetical protein
VRTRSKKPLLIGLLAGPVIAALVDPHIPNTWTAVAILVVIAILTLAWM